MRRTVNIWEYKVGINAIIGNFVRVCEKVELQKHLIITWAVICFLKPNKYIVTIF